MLRSVSKRLSGLRPVVVGMLLCLSWGCGSSDTSPVVPSAGGSGGTDGGTDAAGGGYDAGGGDTGGGGNGGVGGATDAGPEAGPDALAPEVGPEAGDSSAPCEISLLRSRDKNGCVLFNNGAVAYWSVQQSINSLKLIPGSFRDSNCLNLIDQAGAVWDMTQSTQVTGAPISTKIDGTTRHACVLAADGTMSCWGGNELGQLGRGTYAQQSGDVEPPGPVKDLTKVEEIALGRLHSCARVGGQMYCWGDNYNGALGLGTVTTTHPYGIATPAACLGLNTVVKMFVGENNSCARVTSGSVYCWGANDSEQVGPGLADAVGTPTLIAEFAGADLSIGEGFLCWLANGAVRCRGKNTNSQLAGDGLKDVKSLASGQHHTCAQKNDGTVWCWGSGLASPTQVTVSCK